MKGFIEVNYIGYDRFLNTEKIPKVIGKILIAVSKIQTIEGNVITLNNQRYYVVHETYEEIKQKITHAQGEMMETEKKQKIAYLKLKIDYYSGLSKIDVLKNLAYEKIKEYEQELKEIK